MKVPKELGPQAKIDVKKLGNQPILQMKLDEIGEAMKPAGMKHAASYAVHIYTEATSLQMPEAAIVTQLPDMPDLVGEVIAGNSVMILKQCMLAKYGHQQRHNDKRVTGQENLG